MLLGYPLTRHEEKGKKWITKLSKIHRIELADKVIFPQKLLALAKTVYFVTSVLQ